DRVQAARCDDETNAVQHRALVGRQFGSVRMTMADGEDSSQHSRQRDGGRNSNITATPSRTAEAAIPYSIQGICTPTRPSIPPTAIPIGNATGNIQIAGAPSCAPHRPTAIIAST